MKLYHFTSPVHLPHIMRAGQINTTESNVNMAGEGPPVVWLSSRPDPGSQRNWAEGSVVDKTAIRITVNVPDARPWAEWAAEQGIEETWRRALVEAGGGEEAAATWYVLERPIRSNEWVRVQAAR